MGVRRLATRDWRLVTENRLMRKSEEKGVPSTGDLARSRCRLARYSDESMVASRLVRGGASWCVRVRWRCGEGLGKCGRGRGRTKAFTTEAQRKHGEGVE